ncbi:MAG: hypothetical protein ACXIU8_02210 [Alkalilacustris sp.]
MFLHDPAVRAAFPHLHVGLLLLRRADRLTLPSIAAGAVPVCGSDHPVARLSAVFAAGGGLRAAAFDLDRIDGTLEVRLATGHEPFEATDRALCRPDPGEVIFADGTGWVHARDWGRLRSPRSALSGRSRTALVVVQDVRPGAGPAVRAVLDHLAEPLRAAGGAVQTLDLGFPQPGRPQAAAPLAQATRS